MVKRFLSLASLVLALLSLSNLVLAQMQHCYGPANFASPIFSWNGSDLTQFVSPPAQATVIADPTGTAGTTNVVRLEYPSAGAAQNSAYDTNVRLQINVSPASNRVYVRMRYYFNSPLSDGNYCGQRKRLRLWDTLSSPLISGTMSGDVTGITSSSNLFYQGYINYQNTSGTSTLAFSGSGSSDYQWTYPAWISDDYYYDTGNQTTPANFNGQVRHWINGVLDTSELRTNIGPYKESGAGFTGQGWGIVAYGAQLDTYNCTLGFAHAFYSSVTASRTSGVSTLTVQAADQHLSSLFTGKDVIVTGCSDATFNGIQTITSTTASTWVYSNAGSDSTATGCGVAIQGHEYRYFTRMEVYALSSSQDWTNVPSEAAYGFR